MLKKAVQQGRRGVETGGVAFLTHPPQAAKTACSPGGLRWGCFQSENEAREKRVSARRGWAG